MHSIARSCAFISAWRGETVARTFLTPIKPSNPSKVLYHPWPEKISSSFQEPSVKHHFPRIDGRVIASTSGIFFCSFKIYVSTQSIDSVYASLRVSLGSISRLLKTLLFMHFQMYHSIHANWWSLICGITLQKRWSIFTKREIVEKIAGFVGFFREPTPEVREDIKKNTWLIDSSSAPHLAQQVSPCISRACKFFLTAIHTVTNCLENFLFSVNTVFSNKMPSQHQLRAQTILVVFLIWVYPFNLISRFNRIFSIVCEMSSLLICHPSSIQWYTFYQFHILWIHQSRKRLRIPSSQMKINKRIHCKVWVNIVLIFISRSQTSGWEPRIIPYRYRRSCSHPFD